MAYGRLGQSNVFVHCYVDVAVTPSPIVSSKPAVCLSSRWSAGKYQRKFNSGQNLTLRRQIKSVLLNQNRESVTLGASAVSLDYMVPKAG